MDAQRSKGSTLFAIPHNGNASDGRMFELTKFDGKPIDAAYNAARAKNEPLYEITQIKGTSETHPDLSPTDEFAGFELWDYTLSADYERPTRRKGSFVRQALLDGIRAQLVTSEPISRGKREGPVRGFMANTERAAGGLPLQRMPAWIKPLVNWLMPRVGPRGLEFARARVEMKAIESILHLRREAPARIKNMLPAHVWALAARYGLKPELHAPEKPLASDALDTPP
jgi:hypothetical protein